MITPFDVCLPSIVFFILFLTTILVTSYRYFAEPVYPYCVTRENPDVCDESRHQYIMNILILFVAAILWIWILNITCHTYSTMSAWFLVFAPILLILFWYIYYIIV